MASDEEEDLEALRLAALATLKKKPSVVEEAQPIPQLTSSGHSLHNSSSPWTEDFSFDNVPFSEDTPAAQFQNIVWDRQQNPSPEYGQGSPTHYSKNNWRGRGGRGRYQRPFLHGLGSFPPNQRVPFGHKQHLSFGPQAQYSQRNQRPPFSKNPFNQNKHVVPFGQNPVQFTGSVSHGGGGNLIVINTLPEEGEQPEKLNSAGLMPPFTSGSTNRRGALRGGRGGSTTGMVHDGSVPPIDSSSKSMLLRPQDKYCPSADVQAITQEPTPKHHKKKDKFSRFDSSGSDTDDESEDESEDEQPSRRLSLAGQEKEEIIPSDEDDTAADDQYFTKNIPDMEISISAVNTSQLSSDKEKEELESDEFDQPVIDNLGETEEVREESEPELDKEEENDLLVMSSPTNKETQSNPVIDISSPRKISLSHRSGSSSKESSPVKDNSPDPSPVKDNLPTVQQLSHSEKSGESDAESASENSSESGNESDTSSSNSSSTSSTSGRDESSGSISDSESEMSEQKLERNSPLQPDSDCAAPDSDQTSESESGEEKSVRRLPVNSAVSKNPRRSASPKKLEVALSPEEQAKLEARRRKFESGKEVQVTGGKRTISLKGILPRSTKKSKFVQRTDLVSVTNSSASESNERVVQERTTTRKSAALDSHRKHSRRKVSIESLQGGKSNINSEKEDNFESEEEDVEADGSRSWLNEANKYAVPRKTLKVDQPLPESDSYRGNSFRGGSRNGRYNRLRYGSSRDSRSKVHYSSCEDEDQESDRKLFSVVVPKSSASAQSVSNPLGPRSERHTTRAALPNRKRTAIITGQGSDRNASTKSKHYQDVGPFATDGPKSISVVISSDPSSSKRSRSSKNRVPVHQRLGKGCKDLKDTSETKLNDRPVARNKLESASNDDGESDHTELEQRIRRIKKKNAAILRRREEIRQDRELYG